MPGARRSVATAHRIVPAVPPALINDPFTGTNGDAPSTLYWGTPTKSTGSTVDINTNQLRMAGGTLGGYADYQHLPSLSSAGDFDYNIDVVIPVSTTEHFPQVGFRGSGVQESQVGEQTEQTTGYFVDFDVLANLLILRRRTAGANVTLGSVAIDWADNDVAHLRITPLGSSIKVGCTRNAAAPPSTYLITVTDATYPSGKFWLGHAGGADTVADTVRFDNAVVTVPSSNVTGSAARTLDVLRSAASGTSGSGGGQSGFTFAQYKTQVLAERKGYALHVNVTGGQAALSPTVVTNTNNSGAGSLRAAMEGGGNRWIVFDPAAFPPGNETTITLSSYIELRQANSNITVDGFGSRVRITGWGIRTAVYGNPSVGASNICNNIILTNLKIDGIGLGQDNDCIQWQGSDLGWLHHLDLSGGGDGNLDIINEWAGPNTGPNTGITIQNCYLHDSKTGKGCLLGDQTQESEGGGDYAQTSSDFFLGGNGGDCRITIVDSRFKDQLRNPVVSNYHVHMYNTYHHGYTLEGPAIWGLMGHLRTNNIVVDGTGAGANAAKGLNAWRWGLYPDPGREYKRWANSGNVFLGGATQNDQSGGTLNPAGSIFTVPYSFNAEDVSADAGAALIARLTSASLSTQGRAGCVDRDGYYALVGSPGGSPGFDFTVGVDGTAQQILSQSTATIANKRVRVPAGVWADNNNGCWLYFVNKDFGNVELVLEAGATGRGPVSGIEMYGQILNLKITGPGTIEGNGTQTFSEGINIDSTRGDKGANGFAGGNITIDGVTVQPQAGTGPLQRNGVAIWGCGGLTTVKNCTIHDCGSNAFAGFGSAGSGISIGHARRLGASGTITIDNNHIYNVLEVQDGVSADRNGIILDLFHGNFTKYADYFIGNVVVSNNIIHDVSGRGIQDLCGGLSDSLVTISGNQIYGQWARRLGGSAPEAAIGGYGAGTCANVLCSNNTVTFDSGNGGKPAYYFISFDGDGPGVLGSANHVIGSGTSVVFENSRTNTPPRQFRHLGV